MFFFDPLYFVFVMPALLLALWAQWKVQSTFSKYSQVPTRTGINGLQAAQLLINRYRLNVNVTSTPGHLTDHYDPRTKTVAISESSIYNSVASVAVVAHELATRSRIRRTTPRSSCAARLCRRSRWVAGLGRSCSSSACCWPRRR